MTSFRDLHLADEPLVLPNAWDAASARVIERAGALAIATTSAGVAWSLGVPDGGLLDPVAAAEQVERIVAAVDVPVTADIENGYGDVVATVRGMLAAGAVGVNLEDDASRRPERFAAARSVADSDALFVNARIDTYLLSVGDPADRLDETVARAAEYLDAGVDGVFVPGVGDPVVIAELVARIPAPLNIMVGPGSPNVAELGKLGVRRISASGGIALAAYALAARAATEMLTFGTYDNTAADLTHGDLNTYLAH